MSLEVKFKVISDGLRTTHPVQSLLDIDELASTISCLSLVRIKNCVIPQFVIDQCLLRYSPSNERLIVSLLRFVRNHTYSYGIMECLETLLLRYWTVGLAILLKSEYSTQGNCNNLEVFDLCVRKLKSTYTSQAFNQNAYTAFDIVKSYIDENPHDVVRLEELTGSDFVCSVVSEKGSSCGRIVKAAVDRGLTSMDSLVKQGLNVAFSQEDAVAFMKKYSYTTHMHIYNTFMTTIPGNCYLDTYSISTSPATWHIISVACNNPHAFEKGELPTTLWKIMTLNNMPFTLHQMRMLVHLAEFYGLDVAMPPCEIRYIPQISTGLFDVKFLFN